MSEMKIIIITLAFIPIISFSQTTVDTIPENKNVLLEEYHGIQCHWCSYGNAEATYLNSHYDPNDFVVVTIQAGSYSVPYSNQPDYRTLFGDTIHDYANVTLYPSGSINRRVFPQYACEIGYSPIIRDDWGDASDEILAEPSPVNIGAIANFDSLTNELVVDVELYYTDDQSVNINFLNVAILQDNIIGPQEDGGAGGQWTNNYYQHNNMLRHMMTGNWGDSINPISQGTFVTKQYNWTVPSEIYDVPIVVSDLKVVVFVNQTKEETLNVIEIFPIGVPPVIITSVNNQVDQRKRKLVRMIDLLGREVNENINRPILYIYDDGSVEKKIILE